MIYETPQIREEVLKHIHSGDARDLPIIKRYPGYEVCFLAFHPFIVIRTGHEDLIDFTTGKWPEAREIVDHCDPVSWRAFMSLTDIPDYRTMDQAIAFFHCAYSYADKNNFAKILDAMHEHHLIPPQIDNFPQIWQYNLLRFLRQSGYDSVYMYKDTEAKNKLFTIDDLMQHHQTWMPYVRIETPDEKALIVQDFDQRFVYFLGSADWVKTAIDQMPLEGFYCDEQTVESWSFDIISEEDRAGFGDKLT